MNRRLFLASPLALAVKPTQARAMGGPKPYMLWGKEQGPEILAPYYGHGRIIWTSDKGFHI